MRPLHLPAFPRLEWCAPLADHPLASAVVDGLQRSRIVIACIETYRNVGRVGKKILKGFQSVEGAGQDNAVVTVRWDEDRAGRDAVLLDQEMSEKSRPSTLS